MPFVSFYNISHRGWQCLVILTYYNTVVIAFFYHVQRKVYNLDFAKNSFNITLSYLNLKLGKEVHFESFVYFKSTHNTSCVFFLFFLLDCHMIEFSCIIMI